MMWTIGGGLLLLACGVIWIVARKGTAKATAVVATRPDLPHRVTVEVHNTTNVSGMARVGREAVRHAGVDVVQFGNGDSVEGHPARNEVLVRRGDTTGVGRILDALGGGVMVDAPDRFRMVDLTVLLGTDFLRGRTGARP